MIAEDSIEHCSTLVRVEVAHDIGRHLHEITRLEARSFEIAQHVLERNPELGVGFGWD